MGSKVHMSKFQQVRLKGSIQVVPNNFGNNRTFPMSILIKDSMQDINNLSFAMIIFLRFKRFLFIGMFTANIMNTCVTGANIALLA
jgi:hypothetical protein